MGERHRRPHRQRSVRVPLELDTWLAEESDRRVVGYNLLVVVALERLRADIAAYGDLERLPPAPRAPSRPSG